MAVITISRQFGAGGKTLGKMISEKLGYQFLDELIINEISKKAKVSPDWVKSMERSAGGAISKILSGMISRDYMERYVGEDKGYINEEIYVEVLHDVMRRFAEKDNVVLMGRGGQYILNNYEGAYHFLLVAGKEDRIKFMQGYYELSASKAEQAVVRGEKMRANLYRKFGKQDYNEPHLYHLIINMSKCSLERAQELIHSFVAN